jgi:hypothetical protein
MLSYTPWGNMTSVSAMPHSHHALRDGYLGGDGLVRYVLTHTMGDSLRDACTPAMGMPCHHIRRGVTWRRVALCPHIHNWAQRRRVCSLVCVSSRQSACFALDHPALADCALIKCLFSLFEGLATFELSSMAHSVRNPRQAVTLLCVTGGNKPGRSVSGSTKTEPEHTHQTFHCSLTPLTNQNHGVPVRLAQGH